MLKIFEKIKQGGKYKCLHMAIIGLVIISMFAVGMTFSYFSSRTNSSVNLNFARLQTNMTIGEQVSENQVSINASQLTNGSLLFSDDVKVSLSSNSTTAYIRAQVGYKVKENTPVNEIAQAQKMVVALNKNANYNTYSSGSYGWMYSDGYYYLVDDNDDFLVATSSDEFIIFDEDHSPIFPDISTFDFAVADLTYVAFNVSMEAIQSAHIDSSEIESIMDDVFNSSESVYGYFVEFREQGGNNVYNQVVQVTEDNLTLPKVNNVVVSWFDGTNIVGDSDDIITITSDVVLYAVYDETKITVFFEDNYTTDTLPSTAAVTSGTTINVGNKVTRLGYDYTAWVDNNSNTYTITNNQITVTGTAGTAITLRPNWVVVNYTATFDANTGDLTSAYKAMGNYVATGVAGRYTYAYNVETNFTFPEAEKSGSAFQGWKISTSTLANKWRVEDCYIAGALDSGYTGNVTFVAQWGDLELESVSNASIVEENGVSVITAVYSIDNEIYINFRNTTGVVPTYTSSNTNVATIGATYETHCDVGIEGAGETIISAEVIHAGMTSIASYRLVVSPRSIANANIEAIAPQTYTGSEIEPEITVTDGVTELVEDTDYIVSYTSNINVGTASVTITGIGNYNLTKSTTFTIQARSIASAVITLGSALTYNGNAQTQTVASVVVDGITLNSSTDYDISGNTATAAGNYTLTIVGKGNYTGNATANFNIAKKPVGISYAVGSVSKTYGEGAFTNPLTKTGDGVVTYTSSVQDVATVNSNGQVTIVGQGTTIITATVADSANYTYTTNSATYTLTVSKATLTVVADNKSVTYGNSLPAYTVSITGYVGGESASDLTVVPTASCTYAVGGNIGSYTITVSGGQSDNYTFSYTNGTLTVNARQLTATWPNTTSFVYDGIEHVMHATLGNKYSNDDVAFAYTNDAKTNVGNYTSTISLNGTKKGNYTLPTNNTQSWSITNATITGSMSQSGTLTYNGSAQTPVLTDNFVTQGNQTKTITYSTTENGEYSTTKPTYTEASNYTLYYKVSAPNHNTLSGSCGITVNKAVTPTAPTANTLTYNGSAQALVTAGGNEVTWYYSVGTALTGSNYSSAGSTSIPTRTDAGSYTVYYYTPGNSNYGNSSNNQSCSVTISKKAITGTVGITGSVTYGSTISSSVTGGDASATYSYQWKYTTNDGSSYTNCSNNATDASFMVTATRVGVNAVANSVKLKVVYTGTGNYTGTLESSKTALVGKMDSGITLTPSATVTKVFNGTTAVNQTFTATLDALATITGDNAASYVSLTASNPTYDNANVGNSKTVTVSIAGTGSRIGNYNYASSVTTTGAITKATFSQPATAVWSSETLGRATWGEVSSLGGVTVKNYSVQLLKGGSNQGNAVTTTNTYYDFASVIRSAGAGLYTFKVTVVSNNTSNVNNSSAKSSTTTLYATSVTVGTSAITGISSRYIKTSGTTTYVMINGESVNISATVEAGYTFGTWTKSGTVGTIASASASATTFTLAANNTSTESITLTPSVTANTYTITYYNGSANLGNSTHTYAVAKALTTWSTLGGSITNSDKGWSFYGWATANNTTTRTYTDGQSVTSLAESGNVNLYAVYSRTITFKHGVNSASSSTSTQYWNSCGTTNGTHVTSVASPTLTAISNWTANGFRQDTTANAKTLNANASIYPAVNGSNTLYGVYNRTLTFYAGMPKASVGTQTQYYNTNNNTVSSVTSPSATAITNWTILGYRDDATAGVSEQNNNATITPAYTTANDWYAVYSRTLTITYDGNGSTSGSTANTTKLIYLNANSSATSSQTVALASNGFSKTGYTFNKWAAGSVGGSQYAAGADYTAGLDYNASTFGVTMFAIWNANAYTVTFKTANTNMGTQNFVYGTAQNLTAESSLTNRLTGNGWGFYGWSTGTNATRAYTDEQSVSNLTATANGNVTLYAIYTRTVTFKYYNSASATTVTSSNRTQSYYNTSTTAAGVNGVSTYALYTQSTYSWAPLGWVTDSSASSAAVAQTNATTVTVTPAYNSNVRTYYAIYSRTATLAYNGNASTSGSTTSTTGTQKFVANVGTAQGLSLTLASNGFSKTGYTFSQWTAGSTSGTAYNAGASFTFPNTSWDSNSTYTMYAKWTANTYTVTFAANDGTLTKTANLNASYQFTATYDQSYTISSYITNAQRSGYAFNGWKVGSTNTIKANGDSISNLVTSGSITLTAQWATFNYATNPVAKTYGDSAFTNTLTNGSSLTGITYASGTTAVATVNSSNGQVTIVKAGSSVITASVTNKGITSTASYTLNVSKASASISYATTSVSKTYGDSAFTNTLTKTGDGTVTYSSNATGVATVNSSNGQVTIVGQGTATITATVVDGTNNTYAVKTASYTLTVNKKALTWSTKPTISSKTYDGNATATISNHGAISGVVGSDDVSLNSGSASATFNNANAGNSKAITFTGYALSGAKAGNYTLAQPTGVTANITAKALTSTQITAYSATYTRGTSFERVNISTGVGSEKVTVTYVPYAKTVGTYTYAGSAASGKFTITVKNNSNYSISSAGNFTITQKALSWDTKPTVSNKTYNGNTSASISNHGAISGVISGDTCTLNTSSASATFNNASVGNGKAITFTGYALSGADAGNYSLAQPTGVTANITNATIGGTIAQSGTLTYNGSAQTPSIANNLTSTNSQTISVTYCTTQNGTYSSTVPTYTNAGSYTLYYKATASNHSEKSGNFTITVNTRAITITGANASKAYDGTALTSNSSSLTSGTLGSGDTGTYTASGSITNVGSTNNVPNVVIKKSGTDVTSNYSITKVNGTLTITAVAIGGSIAQNGTLTYNGSAQTPNITNNLTSTNSQDITVKYCKTQNGTYSTTVPTYTDAGSYTLYYKATAPNHSEKSGSFTITVNAKSVTLTWSSTSLTYNGNAQKPTISTTATGVTGETLSYTYAVTAKSGSSLTNGNAVNVGSYTVTATATVTGGQAKVANYSLSPLSKDFSIGKANVTLTAPTAITPTPIYSGSAQNVMTTGSVTGGTLYYSADNSNWSTTRPTKTDAGSYTVYYKVTGDTNHNNVNSTSVSVSIAQSVVTLAAKGNFATNAGTKSYVTKVFNNNTTASVTKDTHYTVTATGKVPTVTVSAVYNNKNVANATTVTITGTLSDTTNYTFTGGANSCTVNGKINAATLGTPTNLSVSTTGVISFTGVSNASSYQYKIGSGSYAAVTSGTTNIFSSLVADTDSKTVYVRAVGSGNYATGSATSVQVNIRTITVNAPTNGKIGLSNSANPTADQTTAQTVNVISGGTAYINAVGNTGYHFTSWTKASGTATITATGTASTTVTSITANTTINSAFAINTSTIKLGTTTNVGTVYYGTSSGSITTQLTTSGFTANANQNYYFKTTANTGYTFSAWSGWFTDTTATSSAHSFTNNGSTYTVNASATINSYTITYNTDGGTAISAKSYTITSTDTLPAATGKTGYNFSNWKVTTAGGSWTANATFNSGTSLTGKYGNVTLTAQWSAKTYTITLNKNNSDASGSANGSATATYNGGLSGITAPTRVGYNVEGYYKETGCTNKIATSAGALQASTSYTNSSSAWTNNGAVTLYTKWTAKTYTITLNANGGDSAGSATIIYNNNTLTGITAPTKAGYHVEGYYKEAGCTNKIATMTGTLQASTSYTNSSSAWTNDGAVTLYPKWVENVVTVDIAVTDVLYPNSVIQVALYQGGVKKYGTTTCSNSSSVTFSTVIAGTYNIYTSQSTANASTLVDTGRTTRETGWVAVIYYELTRNQGTGTTLTTKIGSSGGAALSDGAKVLSGQAVYAAASLNTGYNSLSLTVDGTAHTSGNTFTMNAAKTVASSATGNSYTVHYYNGSSDMGTSSHTYGTAKNLTAWASLSNNTVSNSNKGWSFYGWSTANNNTTRTYTDGQSVINLTTTNGGTVNLYAVYTRTVTFYHGVSKANNSTRTQYWNPYGTTSGTHVGVVATPSNSDTTTITNWSKRGYRADTSASDREYNVSANIYPAPSATPTYYAVYSRTLTISYNANGGSGSTSSNAPAIYLNSNSTSTSSQSVTLCANTFTAPTGYSFSKWAAGSTSGTQYSAGASYNPNVAYNASTFGTTMYAIWSAIVYTITIGNVQNGDVANYTDDGSRNITNTTYTELRTNMGVSYFYWYDDYDFDFLNISRTNYTYNGLWTASSGGNKVVNTNGTFVASVSGYTDSSSHWARASNTTLYAQWTANTYTVTFTGVSNFSQNDKFVQWSYTSSSSYSWIRDNAAVIYGWGANPCTSFTVSYGTTVYIYGWSVNDGYGMDFFHFDKTAGTSTLNYLGESDESGYYYYVRYSIIVTSDTTINAWQETIE